MECGGSFRAVATRGELLYAPTAIAASGRPCLHPPTARGQARGQVSSVQRQLVQCCHGAWFHVEPAVHGDRARAVVSVVGWIGRDLQTKHLWRCRTAKYWSSRPPAA